MDFLNRDDLTELLEPREGVHISMFMPLEREPDKAQKNHIRLKDLIDRGQEQLAASSFLPPDVEEKMPDSEAFFQPAEELLGNGRFTADGAQGLAIYLAPGVQHIYYLPLALDQAVEIGPRFYVMPLLPLLNQNGHFYLLTLSQNQAQFWRGDALTLEQVDVPNLPDGQDEALFFEDPERTVQFHTETPQGPNRAAVFHGQEADKEKKGALLRYFREVNKALMARIEGEDVPLLLASVEYLWPIYQEANTYAHLLPEGIPGNPKTLSAHELQQRAWPLINELIEASKGQAAQQLRELVGTKRTAVSIDDVLPAATYGRVAALFVPLGVQERGRFNTSTGSVEHCQDTNYECEDLLNLTVAAALKHDSEVYTFRPEEMPVDAQCAATLRYTVP
ncbi:MAG: hypothetical protein H6661_08665 [Ardenticatenaceae bacterium]|nr:hypothetical protein [Ardenticatenaceae bacterium]